MPIHSSLSDQDFISHVIILAARQRDSDVGGKPQTEDRGDVRVRPYADLCIAYSLDSGYYYYGYSGGAGGITFMEKPNPHQTVDTEMAYRRLKRLSEYISKPATISDDNPKQRPLANCAEANAVSIALSYNESVDRLFLMAFFPDQGTYQRHIYTNDNPPEKLPHLKPPCNNCQTWLNMTYGYWRNGVYLTP